MAIKPKAYYTIAEIAKLNLIGLKSYKWVYNKVRGGLLESKGERHPKLKGGTYGFRVITRQAILKYRRIHWLPEDFTPVVN